MLQHQFKAGRWQIQQISDWQGTHNVLKWETLGANRDRPRKKPWPEDSGLILYQLEDF